MISCDYAYEKKLSRFIFYDTYLKEKKIKNLQQHVENEKNENKALRLFMNDLRIIKKIQYTIKIVIINDIQKYNKIYNENSKFNEISFKDDINHIVQFIRSQLQFIISFLIIKEYNQNARIELLKKISHE